MVAKLNQTPKKVFTPIGDMVAVSIIKGTDTTVGGVVLPESAVGEWNTPVALVIAVGPKVEQVKVGDRVLCHPSTRAEKVRIGKDEYLLVAEKFIGGVMDKTDA